MTTFVLVHGAGHGAWCWEKTEPLLEAAGYGTVSIDLPAQGNDATPISACTLDANVDATRAAIEAQDEPVVLVGHSLGGLTISQAAESIPERIHTLVYLTAFLLRDGECQRDRLAEINNPLLMASRQPSADGTTYQWAGPDLKEVFYHLCSDKDFANAGDRLRPQPAVIGGTPLKLSPGRFGSVRRVYVECSEDKGLLPAFQQKMYGEQLCARVIKLPSDHSPFYSMPERLTDALVEAAAGK